MTTESRVIGYGVGQANIGLAPPPVYLPKGGTFKNLKIGQIAVNGATGVISIQGPTGAPIPFANSSGGDVLTINNLPPTAGNITIAAGTNITIGNAGSTITINSTGGGGGVTSIAGTTNQIAASASTGAVTLSLIGPYTPATYATNGILFGNGTSSIGATATANNSVLVTGSAGVPVLSNTIYAARPISFAISNSNYTLALTDAYQWEEVNNNVSNITITVPPSTSAGGTVAWQVGTEIDFFQTGTGTVTFIGGTNVTLASANSNKQIAVQYGGASLKYTGYSAPNDIWALVGNLS